MYVRRDSTGEIVAVSSEPLADVSEKAKDDEPGLRAFMERHGVASADPMVASDLEMARVLEDVIELLMEQQVFRFTDLPRPAQQKLNQRQMMRSRGRAIDLLGEEDDLDI